MEVQYMLMKLKQRTIFTLGNGIFKQWVSNQHLITNKAVVYIDPLTVTPYSTRIIWTIGVESHHGSPIYAYDVETENHYYPGQWHIQAMD